MKSRRSNTGFFKVPAKLAALSRRAPHPPTLATAPINLRALPANRQADWLAHPVGPSFQNYQTAPLDIRKDTVLLDIRKDTAPSGSRKETALLDIRKDTAPLDTRKDTAPLDSRKDTAPSDTRKDTAPSDIHYHM